LSIFLHWKVFILNHKWFYLMISSSICFSIKFNPYYFDCLLSWQVFKIYISKLTQNKLIDWIRLQDFRSCEFLKFDQIYYICLGLLFFNFTPMFFLSSKFDPYSFKCYLSYLASYCFLKLYHSWVFSFKFFLNIFDWIDWELDLLIKYMWKISRIATFKD